MQLLASGQAVEHIEHATVGDDGDVLARMARSDCVNGRPHPQQHLGGRFPLGRRPQRVALLPAQRFLRVQLANLRVG